MEVRARGAGGAGALGSTVTAGQALAESGYEERAATYAAEIASLAPPRLLDGLLHPGTTVAEMPSGTGHFLRAYAAAGARIERTTRSGAKSWLVKWRLGGGRNGNLFALAIPLRTGFTRQALDAA